jgi:putative hydrolase of HD superfamily
MKDIAKYLYEMGELKRIKRSGWLRAGISNPESVAEHSFRVAIIGYILAYLEGADSLKTATMCLFHNTHETRLTDLHQLAKRYINLGNAEDLVFSEQVERLPQQIADDILSMMHDYDNSISLEGQLTHDADALECLIQAREYQTQGYADVQDWIDNCYAVLKTASARKIAEECMRVEPKEWWPDLKKRIKDE